MVADSSALFNLAKQVDALTTSVYPRITNLCSDPKPVDLLTWLYTATPTGGTSAADSTYAGMAFRVDPNVTFGYGVPFTLPSIGPLGVVDTLTNVPLIPLGTDDITLAFNVRHAVDYVVYARLELSDSDGTSLGVPPVTTADFITGGTDDTWASLGDWGQPKPGGATVRSAWGLDVAAILAAYPTAAYAGLRFSIGQPILIGELSGPVYLGNGSIYAADVTAYADSDTDGWSSNGDGTSSGPAPSNLSWDEVAHPDTFPPSAHTHTEAEVVGLATDLAAINTALGDKQDIATLDADVSDLVDDVAPSATRASIAAMIADATDTAFLPLTTTIGGVPELVWDGNNELVITEVPL